MVVLTIIRYPKPYIPFALFAMIVLRFPLWMNKRISFSKLLGCGKNGSFDKRPDWQQWGLLVVTKDAVLTNNKDVTLSDIWGRFIARWFLLFNCETCSFLLEPLEGHGEWDGKKPFGTLPVQSDHTGPLAVLTRATIRIAKLRAFWSNVDAVADKMKTSDGFITSIGIGELPFIKQATFSIWRDKESMKQFAYGLKEHSEVIKKTRDDNWYSEELFFRFRILKVTGTIKGNNPLKGMF